MNVWTKVTRFIYPVRCLLCQARTDGDPALCSGCRRDLPWIEAACPLCARPLPAAGVCGPCLRKPPAQQASRIALHYAWPVDRLLTGFKYGHRLAYGDLLARLLARRIATRPAALLPVPLHPQRLRERGFNQAAELARGLSRELGIPVLHDLCRRVRATPRQSRLDARQRRRNLRDAFAVRGTPPAHLAIVDDVMTTGSTTRELARCLQRAGARRIEVWCVARA